LRLICALIFIFDLPKSLFAAFNSGAGEMANIKSSLRRGQKTNRFKLTTKTREFVNVATSVALDANLTNAEKAMYLILASYASDSGECYLQQRTIAEHYGCSRRFARSLLKGLREKGCIRWERRKHVNFYQMLR
jgi:CRP-like cAMP-binding protein